MKNNLILQHNALNSIKNAIENNKKDINNQIQDISNLAKRNKYLQSTINHIGGYISLSGCEAVRADVNGLGGITSTDIIKIINHIGGYIYIQ